MGEFVCRVADANGRVFSHVEPAGSLAEARQKLVERGLFVYSVENRSSLLGMFSKRRRERQLGGSDFLSKPFGAEDLRRKVHALVPGSHAMEEG